MHEIWVIWVSLEETLKGVDDFGRIYAKLTKFRFKMKNETREKSIRK